VDASTAIAAPQTGQPARRNLHRFANPGRFLRIAARVQPFLTIPAILLTAIGIGSFALVLVAEQIATPWRSRATAPAWLRPGSGSAS